MPVNITVGQWNLSSDPLQYILAKVHTIKGGVTHGQTKLVDRTYHSNLGNALDSLFYREMLEHDVKSIQELQLALRDTLLTVKRMKEELLAADVRYYASKAAEETDLAQPEDDLSKDE